ncbi:unnamed protein product [Amoebophrya sp. A120]|nr:unnamed protein product [Amoebophrya sp. A120]|eukprot:GSA120T00002285001.1
MKEKMAPDLQFLNQNAPEAACLVSESTCPLCGDPILDAAFETTCCGKLVCESCSKQCAFRDACFHCNLPIGRDAFGFQKSHFATRSLHAERVQCKWCCKVTTLGGMRELGHLPGEHDDQSWHYCASVDPCRVVPRRCPHAGCDFRGPLRKLQEHLAHACPKGYRKLDQEALNICGGLPGLAMHIETIHSWIAHCHPPPPPECLALGLSRMDTQITANVYGSLTSAMEEKPYFVELEEATTSDKYSGGKPTKTLFAPSKSACRAQKQRLRDLLVPDLKASRRRYRFPEDLRAGYQEVLSLFVVDQHNLVHPCKRPPAESLAVQKRTLTMVMDGVSSSVIFQRATEAWRAHYASPSPASQRETRLERDIAARESASVSPSANNRLEARISRSTPSTGSATRRHASRSRSRSRRRGTSTTDHGSRESNTTLNSDDCDTGNTGEKEESPTGEDTDILS